MTNKNTKRGWIQSINRLGVPLFVITIATSIFIFRNTAAFQISNFYAEDATVYFNNIYTHNPLIAISTLFNGYLVVGQYLVGYLAIALNSLLGGHFVNLPFSTALASCLFLGFTVSLPLLLFRKELGTKLSIALVIVGAFVPMASSDYAIIGTLGNLKFAFVYVAFLLLLYRGMHFQERRVYLIDTLLLVCVFTNVTVAFMLPFGIVPYWPNLTSMIKNRSILNQTKNMPLYSILAIGFISFVYVVVVYIHGIPPLPGYLDQPFTEQSIGPVVDRVTSFAWLYPITNTFSNYVVAGLIIIGSTFAWLNSHKRDRLVLGFSLLTILLATGLFILNRPGIGSYFLNYLHKGGPDQFFYAQNLIFIFLSFWFYKSLSAKLSSVQHLLASFILIIYLIWAIPYGTSFGGSRIVYQNLGNIQKDLKAACLQKSSRVILQVYPTQYWQWHVNRERACRDQ